MGWEILAPIIAREGINVAYAIWLKWKANSEPTEADWVELRAIKSADQLYTDTTGLPAPVKPSA